MKKSKKRIVISIIVFIFIILWIGIIYKLSSMNTTNSNGHSKDIISVFIEDTLEVTNKYGITSSYPNEKKLERASTLLNAPLRKVMHASVYFVLAFLIIIGVNILFKNKKYILSALITIVLIIALASFDEYHQTLVEGRTGQVKDVVIDTIGSIAGILFYGTYYLVYRQGYKKGENKN
ncbi:MAG: VanZ family protein [Bacilli bacterium]|nr:VanZ family protein [Bacilli bacterium]